MGAQPGPRLSSELLGVFSNSLLLWGFVFELAFAAAIVYAPPLQDAFGTAALGPGQLALLFPFPFVVWGADELRRYVLRRGPEASSSPSRVSQK